MNRTKKYITIILIIISLVGPLYLKLYKNLRNNNFMFKEEIIEKDSSLGLADIAGTDLYAEQIQAYVAGNKSIIKQSLFTNDTSILSQFDTNDPAFYKCNILISASNAIPPEIFPRILTESEITNHFSFSFNAFSGFLYYDKEMSSDDAKIKAERALEIIKRKFQIDLILLNVTEPNFFPFIGHYPNWEVYFKEITTNLPMDGYWKALDQNRLTNDEYIQNYHISSTIMFINSLDFLECDFNISTDQVNFNLESLDLSFLENLQTENVTQQIDNFEEIYGDILNETISEVELDQFVKIISSFTLSNKSHYTSLMIQYEGLKDGIKSVASNQYEFNLWNAMGYVGAPLAPSQKIYIALIGAFMSDIEINILCTDIIDVTPNYFQFNDFLLEQIGLILFLAGIDFDMETIKEYSFELFWQNKEGIKQSYIKPVNLNNQYNIINYLQQLGFQGFPFIPTGILNPIENLSVQYNTSNSDCNVIITKTPIGNNATYGAYQNFDFNITVENIGNISIWGVPTPIPFELNNFFLIITQGNQQGANLIQNAIWEVVDEMYHNQYDSLEDFFNFDEDPRIFYLDSLGIGTYDRFFPDVTNISNLWPYNEEMDEVAEELYKRYDFLDDIISYDAFIEYFKNKDSIWNSENWKLEPNEKFTYIYNNFSISVIDSFTAFYSNNFTIKETNPKLPALISGISAKGTTPEFALQNDSRSWIIESEERYLNQEEIEIQFLFQNDTSINLTEYRLERVSLIIDFTDPSNNLNFEIFNYSIGKFQDAIPFISSQLNNSYTFSFISYNKSLEWLFDPTAPNNHIVAFKLSGIDTDKFNISINDFDIKFYVRDINPYEALGARISFSSLSGRVHYFRSSNSVILSTYGMASLLAVSYLSNYSAKEGDLVAYTINVTNIGSDKAENINISLLLPGIIDDPINFTLNNNNLSFYLPNLNPYESFQISFSFYVPNTRSLKMVSIIYDNPKNIQGGNSSKLYSNTNEVCISSPIDYVKRYPFLRTVGINYKIINPKQFAPPIGSIFNLTVEIVNLGPVGLLIPDLNTKMRDQFGDLRRIDEKNLLFYNLSFNHTISFNITIKKIDWKGYYYPPINFLKSSESNTIQIFKSSFLVLGNINFSLKKSINRNEVEIGDLISVTIEIENTGTITTKEVQVNDMVSYSPSDFTLTDGKLINVIECLEPGEKASFNYTIKAKRQNIINLKPALISYYFLLKSEEFSNEVKVKIIIPRSRQLMYVLIPIVSALGIFGIYIWQIKKKKLKRYIFRRNELEIFELSSRDSILEQKHTLKERLKEISKYQKENFRLNESKSDLTQKKDESGDIS
ncbi:MAG: hypothetical protein ACFFA3_06310 [Promethearchaeota archaeon]